MPEGPIRPRSYRIRATPTGRRRLDSWPSIPGCGITPGDVELFSEGRHARLYRKLGAHPATVHDRSGTSFSVFAPNATAVHVVGDFNGWSDTAHPMQRLSTSGLWFRFVEGVQPGTRYQYTITRPGGRQVRKSDPFAFLTDLPPETASVVWNLDYRWNDAGWINRRRRRSWKTAPMSIYELHLGSWQRDEHGEHLSYRELAERLIPYLLETGFTHVEFLPPMEHPFYGSWGYQTTGYFAPTRRYGTPQDLMALIDALHQHGIGVILDWVPSHFPADDHGLGSFDGTRLFEYPDPRVGYQPQWKTYVFNYGRGEVISFLISSAMFWLDRYHADGIRVDAVASMLYLDYARAEGQWLRNKFGGRENLEAVEFVRRFNTTLRRAFPDVAIIAEESTSWPGVTRPVHLGGLGFDMKWDMGWMHDTLDYFKLDPVHRKHHQTKLTFRQMYAQTERFMLPLSHDEVVHGKSSLVGKMAGDSWRKFANLRSLYGYMWCLPGKKLLFMGGEFGPWSEWNHDSQLEWQLLDHPEHGGLRRWVSDLNRLYRSEGALYQRDFDDSGFRWVDCSDTEQSVIAFLRRGRGDRDLLLAVGNFTPIPRYDYAIGVPVEGVWSERLNSDAEIYGGSGLGNFGGIASQPIERHGLPQSLRLTLPPLSFSIFKAPSGPRHSIRRLQTEPKAPTAPGSAPDQ